MLSVEHAVVVTKCHMIPKPLLQEILSDKYYKKCVRHEEKRCKGRVTFEHVWIYAGKQVQEKWAIIPLCEYHHDVLSYQDRGDLIKDLNEYYSINRMTEADMQKYDRYDWKQRKQYLNTKYGGR